MNPTDEQVQLAVSTLQSMLALLGLAAKVNGRIAAEIIELQLESDDPAALIGHKGQSIEAFELILDRMLHKQGNEFPRINLCLEGYERRSRGGQRRDMDRGGRGAAGVDEDRLEKQAIDTAKEVKRWGDPKSIGPLPAPARRFVHMLFREDPEIESVSGADDGRGNKKITIKLRGK